MDSKILIEKTETLAEDLFDEIPVLASNGVPDIECASCFAALIKVEEEKNKDRTPGTRSSTRISQNKLEVFTDQECMHNLYLDIAEDEDLMEVSWPRMKPKWLQLFTEEYSQCVDNSSMDDIPVDDSSNILRKRKINKTEDCESTPPKKKFAIEIIELE